MPTRYALWHTWLTMCSVHTLIPLDTQLLSHTCILRYVWLVQRIQGPTVIPCPSFIWCLQATLVHKVWLLCSTLVTQINCKPCSTAQLNWIYCAFEAPEPMEAAGDPCEPGLALPVTRCVHQGWSAYTVCRVPALLFYQAAFIKMPLRSLGNILLVIRVKSFVSYLLHLEIFPFMRNNICELIDKPRAMSTQWNTLMYYLAAPSIITIVLQLIWTTLGEPGFFCVNQTATAKAELYLWASKLMYFTWYPLFAIV